MGNEGSGERETARDAGPTGDQPAPAFRWDDSKMVTRYANAVQVTGTREEIVVLLGTHQVWQNAGRETKEVVVPLEERVLLGPHAAKRLHAQLTLVLGSLRGALRQAEPLGRGFLARIRQGPAATVILNDRREKVRPAG